MESENMFETQDMQLGKPLTCKQFVEEFNAISEDYVADRYLNYVEIYDAESGADSGFQVARLDPSSWYWLFECEERAYSWQELNLMARIAATSPAFRNTEEEDLNGMANTMEARS